MTEKDLLDAIERFLLERDITPTGFGRLALHDPNFVFDLRAGREVRRATRQKVSDFMRRNGHDVASAGSS